MLLQLIFLDLIFEVNGVFFTQMPVKPERCYGTNDIFERHCCHLPGFFDSEVFRSCGGVIVVTNYDKVLDTAIVKRHYPGQCSYWECVLDKYKILNTDRSVNDEKFYTHLEKWAALNSEFSAVILKAKVHCRQRFRLFMPLMICEFYQFLLCFRNFMNLNCPRVIQTDECFKWKEFFDECAEFYI